MDSNRNYLDLDLLWENLTLVPTGNMSELLQNLEKNDLRDYDVVVIHVGVNDIDRTEGREVAKRLINVTSRIKAAAPGIQIILSEVTPRQLTRDDEVIACNEELRILQGTDNITLAKHSNLRDKQWSFHKPKDDKHFTKPAIARLAGNLKSAFRKAMNIRPRRSSNNDRYNKGNVRNSNAGKSKNDKQLLLKKLIQLLS